MEPTGCRVPGQPRAFGIQPGMPSFLCSYRTNFCEDSDFTHSLQDLWYFRVRNRGPVLNELLSTPNECCCLIVRPEHGITAKRA